MARKGRKRKIVPREANGQRKREPKHVAAENQREVAMNQPHRRGSASERLSTAVGRLLATSGDMYAGKSENALHEAASAFERALRNYRKVTGCPQPHDGGMTTGIDIPPAIARRWVDEWLGAERYLRLSGEQQWRAVHHVVTEPQPEDWQPPFWIRISCIEGLTILAAYFGIDVSGEDKAAPAHVRGAA